MKKVFLLIWAVMSISAGTYAQTAIQGDITSNMTLTSGNSYILKGFVRVKTGATLTIEPGTIIYGENVSQGSLIIQPGGKLIADGKADRPIIFTSQYDRAGSSQAPVRGDWGGIIVLGNAPINVPGGTAKIEGPGDTYGGTNPNDNSGIIRYVQIKYAGIAFSPNNEINGLTFGGVGNGTIVDYVQVSYSNDDSFEWFGGTVNCKHLIAYRGLDDDFDTDFGYSGKLQFLLGIRDPEIADVSQSNGFESDNDGTGSLNTPRTSPTWWNVTLVGPKKDAAAAINSLYKRGMHLKRSSQNKISNALVMGWPIGIVVDGKQTSADAASNLVYVKNSIVAGCDKALDSVATNGSFDLAGWFGNGGGRILASAAEAKLTDAFNLNKPNVFPLSGSPVYTNAATPPDDGFFDAKAAYIGAFGNMNWTIGWTSPEFVPSVTDVEELPASGRPAEYSLGQNYPNPFNPVTTITYSIAAEGNTRLAVYNMLGEQVALLVNEHQAAGKYNVRLDASNLTSGVYIYRIESGTSVISRKMTLLK